MEDVLKMCHDMHVVGLFKKNSYKSSLAKAMLESLLKDAWKYNKSCEKFHRRSINGKLVMPLNNILVVEVFNYW